MKWTRLKWIRILDICGAALLVVGGLNWGLVGVFHVDLIAAICGGMEFGESNVFSRLIYSLVGIAAVYAAYQVVSLKGLEERWNIRRHEGPNVPA